jgi:hypothetical protein
MTTHEALDDVEYALRTVCREQIEMLRRALFDAGVDDAEIDRFVGRSRDAVERGIPPAVESVKQAIDGLAA